MGIFGGAVVGTIVHSVAVSRSVKKASLSRFPLAGRMAIGITNSRILVWQRAGLLGNTVKTLVGEVPLGRLSGVEVEPIPGRVKLTFVLRDARPVMVEADKRDAPERLVEAFDLYAAAEAVATLAAVSSELAAPSAAPWAEPPRAVAVAAPAAPAATAVADQAGKDCFACQTHNPSSAEFCWRCLAPFGPQPHVPVERPRHAADGAGGVDGAKSQAARWTLAAKVKVGALVAIPLVITVLLAALAFKGADRSGRGSVSMPATIAGAQRITTAAARQAEERILAAAKRRGFTGKAGLYGTGDSIFFGVAVYDNFAGFGGPAQVLMEPLFSVAAGPSSGSSVDLATLTADSAGDVTYRCAAVLGRAAGAGCVWQTSTGSGAVLALNQGISQARSLAEAARASLQTVLQPSAPGTVYPV